MQTNLDQAKDLLGKAHRLLEDGKRLYELSIEAGKTDSGLSKELERISLTMLDVGETMLNNVEKVERSYSKRF